MYYTSLRSAVPHVSLQLPDCPSTSFQITYAFSAVVSDADLFSVRHIACSVPLYWYTIRTSSSACAAFGQALFMSLDFNL